MIILFKFHIGLYHFYKVLIHKKWSMFNLHTCNILIHLNYHFSTNHNVRTALVIISLNHYFSFFLFLSQFFLKKLSTLHSAFLFFPSSIKSFNESYTDIICNRNVCSSLGIRSNRSCYGSSE